MTYSSTFSTFNKPNPTDRLNNPSHSALHNTVSSAIGQLEAVVGLAGDSSVLGTIIGDLRSPASGGGGHVQGAAFGGTGQTTFTKGDMLVATSASVITKLAVGTDGQSPVADSTAASGIRWGNGGVNVQSFLSGGTWNKPSAASGVLVQVWGGGGAGGKGGTAPQAGGGGGGGAYNQAFFPASVLGTAISVAIGAGGASVFSATQGVTGNSGGTTTFGSATSLLSAFGGGGGDSGNNQGGGGGGGGIFGAGAAGNFNGGAGGSPYGATGGNSGASSNSGSVAAGFGGAGGGGADINSTNVATGGQGFWGGAGGGGAGAASGTGGSGGNAVMGGAGGGGGGGTGAAGGAGGKSSSGGNGGAGGSASIIGTQGSVLGGGGGGSEWARSGAGGDGFAIITTFLS